MPLSIAEARDEMCAVLKTAIDASSFPSTLILWDDSAIDPPVDTTVTWLRMSIRHAIGGPASLGSPTGKKRFRSAGVLVVQVFTEPGKGLSTSDELVTIIRSAYESGGTPNGVWFRNVYHKEVDSSGWRQVNVLAEFEYDTVR